MPKPREQFYVSIATDEMTPAAFASRFGEFLEMAWQEVRWLHVSDPVDLIQFSFRTPNPDEEIIQYPPYCAAFIFLAPRK